MTDKIKKYLIHYYRYRREIDALESGIKYKTDWNSPDSLNCYIMTMWEDESIEEWFIPEMKDWINLNIYYLSHPNFDPETKKDIRKLLPDASSPILYIDWQSAIKW